MEDFIAYYNGEYLQKTKISLSIDNPGFTRGYGAYECFRTYNRNPFRLKDHIKRLKKTCDQLLIAFPKEDLFEITENLIEKNEDTELVFRIYVTDDTETGSYHLIFFCNTPESFNISHPSNIPLKLKSVLDTRENRNIKSTSYSKAMIEIKKAKKEGFDDILFTNEKDYIHELSRANFFAIKGSTLYTPIKNFLPGITRLTIIEFSKDYGFEVKEIEMHKDFLEDAEEVFASSTIRGITPVGKVDHLNFDRHEKTKLLKSYFISLSSSLDNHDKRHLSASHS